MKEMYGLYITEQGEKMNLENKKDYVIVETNESILFRFNSTFIDLLGNIRKKNFHKSQENYNYLIRLYTKFSNEFSKKQNLGILLDEIKRKLEFRGIEFNELPTKRVLNKEERKLDVLSRFIKHYKLQECKLERGDYNLKPKVSKVNFEKVKKKIDSKEKKLTEVRKLILKKKYIRARKLLKQDL